MDIIADAEAALGFGASTPAPVTPDPARVVAPAPPVAPDSGLIAAIRAIAPAADAETWAAAFTAPMAAADISTQNRVAAFLGNGAVESARFSVLSEDLTYTLASHIYAVYRTHFASEADAEACVRNPELLANTVYANELGNGDSASGDGWRFRGAGAFQCTGRSNMTEFAATVGRTPEDAADWCRTIEGAAASACWYWSTRGLNALADNWELSRITAAVNGRAMLGNAERIQLANAARDALNSAAATS